MPRGKYFIYYQGFTGERFFVGIRRRWARFSEKIDDSKLYVRPESALATMNRLIASFHVKPERVCVREYGNLRLIYDGKECY